MPKFAIFQHFIEEMHSSDWNNHIIFKFCKYVITRNV